MSSNMVYLTVTLDDSHHDHDSQTRVGKCLIHTGCTFIQSDQNGVFIVRISEDRAKELWKINGVSLVSEHNDNHLDRS